MVELKGSVKKYITEQKGSVIKVPGGQGVAAGLLGVAGATQSVKALGGKVGSALEKGDNIVKSGRAILQDPSTTMANMRTIVKDVGGARKGLQQTFNEAKQVGTGMKKIKFR